MYNPIKYFKQLEPQIRKMSKHRASQKSHYDALGISSKATQADVKSAYYKLSMVYHPDKNKESVSEDAATKFRDISEAYEVLGNVRTRKLYDRGLLFHNVGSPIPEETPLNKFYKARAPTPYGRTTVYDFDEWSRSHYGATFAKDMRFKQQEKFRQMRKQQTAQDIKSEKMILLVGMMFLFVAYLFYDKDYDTPERVSVFGGGVYVGPKSDQR